MLKFDVNNPFPLLAEEQYTHQEAKDHAAAVDDWLGFQIATVETLVSTDERYNPHMTNRSRSFLSEYWRGLPPAVLQTPYVEIRWLLEQLEILQDSILVDLGSGFGRMAHVICRHFTQLSFLGIEFVEPRFLESVRVAKLHKLERAKFQCWDISSIGFEMPHADHYFIYDFGSKPAIRRALAQIQEHAKKRSLTVVGRGRATRDLIEKENPWLSEINSPRHFRSFSIYKS